MPHPSEANFAGTECAALLQAIVDHDPSMVIVIDAELRILAINRVVDGMRASDVLGTSCLDYMPPEDHARVRQTIDQVIGTGQPGRYEVRGRVADGSFGYWVTQVLPVRADAGAARALLRTIDITDRRRAEQAVRHSEAMFRALLAASSDDVYRMGPDWSEMRFLDGRDFIDDTAHPNVSWLEQYIPDEDQPVVRAAIERAIRERQPFALTHRVRRVDGSLGWTQSRAVPLLDEQGAIVEWIGMASDVTERLAARAALAASEERLRLAMDATGEGVWDWNIATGACWFSPAYFAMLGYQADVIRSDVSAVQSLLHPDDLDVARRGPTLLRDPGHFVLRFRLRAASGDYRWVESHGKTVQRADDGSPLRAVGTHVDVTEQRRLEQALHESESRLRAIIDSTTDIVFVKDLQGRFLLANQALCTATGLPADRLLGRDAGVFLPADAAQRMDVVDRQLLAEGAVVSAQERWQWTPTETRDFLVTKGPLRNDAGQVVGLFGTARDITDLLRREEAQRRALAESRDLLELALSAAELGTFEVDLDDGSARLDDRYLAMLGYQPGELTPSMGHWLQRVHPDDRAAVTDAIDAHRRGETRLYESEHRLRHKDGHWVWVMARGKVVRDASGNAVRAVGTHQDITDRKRMATEGTALLKKIEGLIAGLAPRPTPSAPRDAAAARPLPVPLSQRHRQVLELLAGGLTASEIARRLGISVETANTHRRNLMRKLGLRNKAELIRFALHHGLGKDGAPDTNG